MRFLQEDTIRDSFAEPFNNGGGSGAALVSMFGTGSVGSLVAMTREPEPAFAAPDFMDVLPLPPLVAPAIRAISAPTAPAPDTSFGGLISHFRDVLQAPIAPAQSPPWSDGFVPVTGATFASMTPGALPGTVSPATFRAPPSTPTVLRIPTTPALTAAPTATIQKPGDGAGPTTQQLMLLAAAGLAAWLIW